MVVPKQHTTCVLHGEPGRVLSAAEYAQFASNLLGKDNLVDFTGTKADAAKADAASAKECFASDLRCVRVLGNTLDEADSSKALLCRIGYEWHSDGSIGAGALSLLHCLKTPAGGGETLFADARKLYDALSAEQKALADGLTAVQSNTSTAGGPAAVDCEHGVRMDATGTRRVRDATSRRPGWRSGETRSLLVLTHAISGRKVIASGGKNLDYLEGPDGPLSGTASGQLLSDLLLTGLRGPDSAALKTAAVGEDGLPTSATEFWSETVLAHAWRAGDIVLCVPPQSTSTPEPAPGPLRPSPKRGEPCGMAGGTIWRLCTQPPRWRYMERASASSSTSSASAEARRRASKTRWRCLARQSLQRRTRIESGTTMNFTPAPPPTALLRHLLFYYAAAANRVVFVERSPPALII